MPSLVKRDQARNRLTAGTAPGTPEVQNDDLPLEIAERYLFFTIEVREGEFEWKFWGRDRQALGLLARQGELRVFVGLQRCLVLRRRPQRIHRFIGFDLTARIEA